MRLDSQKGEASLCYFTPNPPFMAENLQLFRNGKAAVYLCGNRREFSDSLKFYFAYPNSDNIFHLMEFANSMTFYFGIRQMCLREKI